jgi:RsiW-degrading membrane proteinase PrsW (M82 family)
MTALSFIALAIGPGFALVHVAWMRDRRREPWLNVLLYFALGAVSVLVAGWVEAWIEMPLLQTTPESASAPRLLLWSFLGVALVEEAAKGLAVFGLARRDRHIDEPFDWIVYSVAVALGFATLENVQYVYEYGANTGFVRAFTAVPAHALDGTLMGTRLARAMLVTGPARSKQRALAVLEPALWHAAYDFPLFLTVHETHSERSTLYTVLWSACSCRNGVCVCRACGLGRATSTVACRPSWCPSR